jgi:hypothetical protein
MLIAQTQRTGYDGLMATVNQTLRAALRDCGRTRMEVSRATGIDHSVLWRFLQGQPLRGNNLDRLCEYLGLRLTGVGKPRRTARARPPKRRNAR